MDISIEIAKSHLSKFLEETLLLCIIAGDNTGRNLRLHYRYISLSFMPMDSTTVRITL